MIFWFLSWGKASHQDTATNGKSIEDGLELEAALETIRTMGGLTYRMGRISSWESHQKQFIEFQYFDFE
jgi:hypothetical protein